MKARISMVAVACLVIVLTCSLGVAQVQPPLDDKGRVQLPARPTYNPGADDKGRVASMNDMMSLGSIWQVTECCGWSGTWTRRAGTNTFDAKWRHTNGSQAQDVITLQSWNKATNEIVLQRPSINGTYRATVNPATRSITSGTASWYPAGEKWSARY